MRQIELEHPAVLETIRRILNRENKVPKSSVRDFDGNEFTIKVDMASKTDEETGAVTYIDEVSQKLFKGGSLTIEIAHSLSASWIEKNGCKPFLVKTMQRHFAHAPECFSIGGGGDKATVTVKLDTSKMTIDEVIDHPTVRKASSLRLLVIMAPFLYEFEHFLVSKNAGQDMPFMHLPFSKGGGGGGNDTKMFLYSANANFVCLLYMRVEDVDERIFVRTFLTEMQTMSGNASKGLSGSIGMSFVAGAKAPSVPASAPGVPAATDDCFFVTFVVSKRHMDPVETAEKVVRQLVDFRAYLSYHVGCCKSNLHAAMRQRAEQSLLVINRAKTKTTGRPRIAIE